MEMSIGFPRLGLELSNVGKIISISGFEITFSGLLIAAGMLAGVWFTVLMAKRTNQNQNSYLAAMILEIVFGVIGARLLYVFCNWDSYRENTEQIWNLRGGGAAIYGGLLAGIIVLYLYCRIKDMSFDKMADTTCMGLLLGQIIGRWGDFFSRTGFGGFCDYLLSMRLPVSVVNPGEITEAMQNHLVTIQQEEFILVHPAFFYEFLWNLLLLGFLSWYRRRKRFEGELFWIYLTGYGVGRAWIEYLRTDKLCWPNTEIPVSLVLSAGIAVLGILVIITRRTMTRKRMEVLKKRRETLEAIENQENQEKEEMPDFWNLDHRAKTKETPQEGENANEEPRVNDVTQGDREEEGDSGSEDQKQRGSGEEPPAQ